MPTPRTFAAAVVAVAVLCVGPVAAAGSVFLEELTSPELRERIAAGTTTVIVPVGGTEQNGPHLVLGKHNVRAKLLAGRIARELGDALVAPVLAYVPEGGLAPPTGHMRFPGTITIPAATFRSVIESASRSFRLHGFRDIVLLGDSGDTQRDLAAVAARLNREWAATPVRVHAIREYYLAAGAPYARLLRERGVRDDEIGTHAGIGDTSLALALDPALVRTDRLAARAAPADGVRGDPQRASADLGRPGVEAIVAASVTAIRAAVARR